MRALAPLLLVLALLAAPFAAAGYAMDHPPVPADAHAHAAPVGHAGACCEPGAARAAAACIGDALLLSGAAEPPFASARARLAPAGDLPRRGRVPDVPLDPPRA
ncbi:hypothetical protein [Jannaschia sp. W003]|uniref:hypothetical protein n=1 Tax=Jannaschia sp. W003 TaxID=2867012 RepID=UPI0021A55C4C|nr:hypothetical protein [Jannaschia sp. W003]UWQ22084.1 hypothetical protein K3554_03365 [Jannaschia sp. W003]